MSTMLTQVKSFKENINAQLRLNDLNQPKPKYLMKCEHIKEIMHSTPFTIQCYQNQGPTVLTRHKRLLKSKPKTT